MNDTLKFIGSLILFIIAMYVIFPIIRGIKEKLTDYYNDPRLEKVSINNKSYSVCNNYDDMDVATGLINIADTRMIKLINHIEKKYANTSNQAVKDGITNMINRYRSDRIRENIPSKINDDTSYTIDKGQVFAVCLRNIKDNNALHTINDIMFVVIHELAHIFSKTYGHNNEFWTNFKFLLHEANEINIYNSIDYSKNNIDYCGMKITYNPIYDNTLNDLRL
jgi:predicted metal-dependent hydrolase